MSDSVTAPPTDITALLQAETRSLAAVYEREAYLVYNVALRTSRDEDAAARAAQRAFLATADVDGDRDELLRAAVHAALAEAPAVCEPSEELLRASAALRPAERAALALATLAELDADGIATALDVPRESADGLLERGRSQLADAVGVEPAGLDGVLAQWLWAVPPTALWEQVFAERYRAVEARLRAGEQPTVAIAPEPAAAQPPREASRGTLARAGRWLGGTLAVAAIGVAATQLAAGAGAGGSGPVAPGAPQGDGVAVAAAPPPASGTVVDEPATATTPAAAPGTTAVRRAKPLTAQELDHLRMAELQHLQVYAKRQADKRLSPSERLQAAREIDRIRNLALKRLEAAARREERLRRELARARAKEHSAARPKPADSAPAKQAPPPAPAPQPTATTPQQTSTTQESGCLYNESDGTYVCPQDDGGDTTTGTTASAPPPSG